MTISVVVAASLSMGLLAVSMGRSNSTQSRIKLETALSIAESGLSRGLAEANKAANKVDPTWPRDGLTIDTSPNNTVRDANNAAVVAGSFTVEFRRGDTDGKDNDNNGAVDDVGEASYVILSSTGYVGEVSASNPFKIKLEGVSLKVINLFNINSALFIDDPLPHVKLNSSPNWKIDGRDHDMISQAPLVGGGLPGLATTGAWDNSAPDRGADVIASETTGDPPAPDKQIIGSPSGAQTGLADNIDINTIMTWGAQNADAINPASVLGTPPSLLNPAGDFKVTYYSGSTSLNGSTGVGAGILIVDGNLTLNGACQFVGIVIVRGKIDQNGGGGSNQLIGATVGGGASVVDYSTNGTTDVMYSSAAVTAAKNAAAKYSFVAWRQVGTN
jgi:hypothetical protein